MIDGIKRNSRIYVGDSIVRKTDTRLSKEEDVVGSFFQHGNNSGKRDTVAFHGACNECSTNVDDLRISNTTLTCLAFQTCMTLCV